MITRIYFSLCGVRSMPLRWKNALLISIIIIVLALRFKKKTKKKESKKANRVVECCTDSTRNVVFLFLYESSNLKRGPLPSSRRQGGVKQTANDFRRHETKIWLDNYVRFSRINDWSQLTVLYMWKMRALWKEKYWCWCHGVFSLLFLLLKPVFLQSSLKPLCGTFLVMSC